MAAPFRIYQNRGLRSNDEAFKDYLSRLLKLIPSEIVGLYMVGSGFIPEDQHVGAVVWAVFCFAMLIASRIYGTSDSAQNLPPQPVPIVLACVAFMVWIYWLGGPFTAYHMHVGWVGSLLVLAVSFIAPIFYKGS